ncbi:MAG: VWA domain-containing protein [Acidobacteria bacterium]|nr:VWA domain-containing protein [Acidobacteriota bacterium]
MKFHPIAAAALLLAALPAAPQDTPLPDLFADVIDVRVVNVEVVVTDRKGNRIRGLEASDFELRVDGEPVPIEYFTEIDDGRARTSLDDGVGNVPSLTPDKQVGTNYLVFIDELSAIRRDRDRVLNGLEQDLALLSPADRVAVVAFDGYNLARLTDWTNSRDEIEHALQQARERKGLGLMRMTGLGDQTEQTRRAVLAATATVRSFAGAPGRKAMLLLADGWSGSVDSFGRSTLASPVSLYTSTWDVVRPLVDAANLVGYTLYPVNLPGLRFSVDLGLSRDDITAFRHPRSHPLSYPHRNPFYVGDDLVDSWLINPFPLFPSASSQWSRQAALRHLAGETGGLAMINAQRDEALAIATDDTRSYYWLGFEPPRDENDVLHDIDVRVVGRRNLRVRARESYMDMSKSTEVTMLVEGSLLFGGSPGTDSLDVRFGTPERAGFRKIAVPMEVTIPLDDLTLLPIGGQWMNELEFRVTVINERGDRSEIPVRRIPILGPAAPLPGQTFTYDTGIVIRRREHRYVAAIYDPLSGAILSSSGEVGSSQRPEPKRRVRR